MLVKQQTQHTSPKEGNIVNNNKATCKSYKTQVANYK